MGCSNSTAAAGPKNVDDTAVRGFDGEDYDTASLWNAHYDSNAIWKGYYSQDGK